jgi:hypothetical protein
MSVATTKTRGAPARRPAPAKCCQRCGSAILGHVQICEISRLTRGGPEMERYILCCGFYDAIRAYVGMRAGPPG